MKAKLMVGGLLQDKEGSIYRITALEEGFESDDIAEAFNIQVQGDYMFHAKLGLDLFRIPLTEDIFALNCDEDWKCESRTYGLNIDKENGDRWYVEVDLLKSLGFCQLNIEDSPNDVNVSIRVRYVDEVQTAFYLCGLSEFSKVFRVI